MSYISSSFPRFAEHMEPHELVFQLAKAGKIRQLKQYLARKNKDERKRIVSTKYNGATCLIMACRNGHYEVVEYLIEYSNSNLEQTGLVNFEGENIEGAPPLWCASAAGHTKIVKYLVSKGANVNSTTKSNSTALRAACFDGHLEIVKFLVENNADIEIANRHGHTCLMIACYKGHLAIAKYLIMKGADLNRKSVKGNTALHDCAECGSLEIMKLLLSHSAKMAPDAYQMTPILAAAVTGHSAIVDYLLGRPECEQSEKISALELLGATYVDKKHDMLSAYNYWKSALERRSTPFNDPVTNQPLALTKELTIKHTPIEAYDFATEFMCQRELDECLVDPDDVRMQALLIRERILGPTHPDTTYYIRYRGAVYADCGNFRKCILLWLYALETQQKSLESFHPMIQSSFLSFTELFQYMQKQLLPVGGNGGGETGGGGAQSREMNDYSRDNATSLNVLNMYTNTVIKILQQAVDEIKRGVGKVKQAQISVETLVVNPMKSEKMTSTTAAASNPIIQMQRQQIQTSNAYGKATNIQESPVSSPSSPTISSPVSNVPQSPSTKMTTATSSTLSANNDLDSSSSIDSSASSSLLLADSPPSPPSSANEQQTIATVAVVVAVGAHNQITASTSHELASSSSAATSAGGSASIATNSANVEMAHFDRTLVVIVHFLIVVAESLKYCSPEETYKLKKLVYELVKLNPKNSKKSTLLHLAASRESSSVIKNHTLSSCPSTEALRLLLECGADPNALDNERNSPLHLAAANRHFPLATNNPTVANIMPANNNLGSNNENNEVAPVGAVAAANNNNINNSPPGGGGASSLAVNSERDKIICLLLNAKTHLDACNVHNKTAADLYKGGKMYQVINPINYLTLQCLAAKVIQKNGIPYKEHLTSKLANFVSIH